MFDDIAYLIITFLPARRSEHGNVMIARKVIVVGIECGVAALYPYGYNINEVNMLVEEYLLNLRKFHINMSSYIWQSNICINILY